jgi:hypothetical protein
MAELKTKQTDASVEKFLASIKDEGRREECRTIARMMQKATRSEPKMWGKSIVGFGTYHYVYASGREGDWMMMGFSPRKQNLTLYIMPNLDPFASLLKKLGPHSTGKSCLYIKRLEDINLSVLETIVKNSVTALTKRRQPTASRPGTGLRAGASGRVRTRSRTPP